MARLSASEYEVIVLTKVAQLSRVGDGEVGLAHLRAVREHVTGLCQRAALSRMIRAKEIEAQATADKEELEAIYALWVSYGKPTKTLRRIDGVLGFEGRA